MIIQCIFSKNGKQKHAENMKIPLKTEKVREKDILHNNFKHIIIFK